MLAQRNYGLYLAMLAVIGLAASTALAEGKTPTTQPASPSNAAVLPASAVTPPAASATQTPTTQPAEVAAKEIPLDKVWAYQMPGTHPMEMPLAEDDKIEVHWQNEEDLWDEMWTRR